MTWPYLTGGQRFTTHWLIVTQTRQIQTQTADTDDLLRMKGRRRRRRRRHVSIPDWRLSLSWPRSCRARPSCFRPGHLFCSRPPREQRTGCFIYHNSLRNGFLVHGVQKSSSDMFVSSHDDEACRLYNGPICVKHRYIYQTFK